MFRIQAKQPELTALMDRVLRQGRLGHAYIFEGEAGAGQAEMADYVAAALFCQGEDKPCGQCRNCQLLVQGDLPDLVHVEPEGQSLKIDQMREIKQELSLTAMGGGHKVFIIHDAEKMTNSAANSLLKFLEEPNPEVYIFLLTSQKERLLATIQSRCQVIHFKSLPLDQVRLTYQEAGISSQVSEYLAALTSDLSLAQDLAEDEAFLDQTKRSWTWLEALVKQDPRAFTMVQTDWIKRDKGRETNQRLLEIILAYLRDLLILNYQETDQLILPSRTSAYQDLRRQVNPRRLQNQVQLALKARRMIQANVSPQAALEYFVLASWQG
ncbi:DNA polymerase III subunit delta' [Aerococcus sp. UMB10185]|uniref:DNA polymerase III subunit delta' n=1 Tax=unclassified Aerococcus TaxID=2618060 RepID=UPI0008A21C1F|nr:MULTISPECIES: DNA polymerase III subunit delta' [unclassified Aerococcus]KAB0646278.1 DNA polymerase III subunit delta' [Aerococcus sanguinicola]MDK6233111.1 DNA polymerase III subunit delta' [Aerococcus sp. UMB10185]MDK6855683.1 DNA polymerase III subunit delta' [Aerococcus sp. UMB7533]OFN00223.1 hypothetical protein HMPREF2626_09830 [Aerococcus sp. HMSC062A02]OHO44983.1 hypothetical protein HMPREF2705_06320 [Aerococcus sp. HMSC035B07]